MRPRISNTKTRRRRKHEEDEGTRTGITRRI
jgi:hypothetical protein